ncbi:MAG: GAF domain-containing protein [Proteobacteria bacterium]|nr:GAF domain-containing protein [Pseudomonadota bacterium]
MSESRSAEQERIEQLHELGVLNTHEDKRFRSCVDEALKIFEGATIAAITLVDVDRQWFKSIVGFDMTETPRNQSFCSYTIESRGVVVVEDATKDPRFNTNPLVTGAPNMRFYAGVKLVNRVGALCVISNTPRRAKKAEIHKLVSLARFVDIQLLAHGTLHNLDNVSV